MSEWSDFTDEETGETAADGAVACSEPCPEGDGHCGYAVGHLARHRCRTDTTHRWDTEYPS